MSVELESAKRLTTLKNKIDTKTGTQSNTLSESVDNVIAGYGQGGSGGDSYYDAFWDAYQNYGNRKNYEYAFNAGVDKISNPNRNEPNWTMASFRPKYDLKPTTANYMFVRFKMYKNNGTDHTDTLIQDFDLEAHLNQCGISLDFSECSILSAVFQQAYVGVLPIIDASSATGNGMSVTFDSCSKLKTIRKLIVTRNITQYNHTFKQCTELANIDIEGEIAASIDFSACKDLTPESRQSIVNALIYFEGETLPILKVHSSQMDMFIAEHLTTIEAKNWQLQ